LKDAREAFARGLKLNDRHQLEGAFAQFDEAVRLFPQNPQFLTARETVKAQLVFKHVERGNSLLAEDARIRAAAEFQAALDLDPGNEFVLERISEATRPSLYTPDTVSPVVARLAESEEIHLEPNEGNATFHFNGTVHSLFEQLGAAYGVKVQFDD